MSDKSTHTDNVSSVLTEPNVDVSRSADMGLPMSLVRPQCRQSNTAPHNTIRWNDQAQDIIV